MFLWASLTANTKLTRLKAAQRNEAFWSKYWSHSGENDTSCVKTGSLSLWSSPHKNGGQITTRMKLVCRYTTQTGTISEWRWKGTRSCWWRRRRWRRWRESVNGRRRSDVVTNSVPGVDARLLSPNVWDTSEPASLLQNLPTYSHCRLFDSVHRVSRTNSDSYLESSHAANAVFTRGAPTVIAEGNTRRREGWEVDYFKCERIIKSQRSNISTSNQVIIKGIFQCKFNPCSNTLWNCVRLPLQRSS